MNGAVQPIDYTNLGFDALREAMLGRARELLPEWTDLSPNDLGVLLIDLLAYASDITLYYQTRIAANLLPATSDEPDALVQLLRFIGYELVPPSPATADLRLSFDAGVVVLPLTIPAGTQFFVTLASGEQLTFEVEGETVITQLTQPDAANLRYFYPLPVVEGVSVLNEQIGISDGTPNQTFTLLQKPVIAGSITVSVAEPAGPTRWTVVDSLLNSSPADRHLVAQRTIDGAVTLLAGDNFNGMVPPRGTPVTPVTVTASYRVGGGPQGNVAAGTEFVPALPIIQTATNPTAAAGGRPVEDTEGAVSLAPRLFRAQDRAVTANDYRDLALQVPGVGKARAVAAGWNNVALYVAPYGQVAEPSELLKRDLLAFFEQRRMATVAVNIVAPQAADIYLVARVRALPYFANADVQKAVEDAVAGYLAFDNVDFGQQIYLSKVYDVIQSLPQVASLLITRFSRSPAGTIDTDGTIALEPNELPRPGYRDNPNTLYDITRPAYRPPIALVVEGGTT